MGGLANPGLLGYRGTVTKFFKMGFNFLPSNFDFSPFLYPIYLKFSYRTIHFDGALSKRLLAFSNTVDLSKVMRHVKKFGFKNGQSKVYTNQSIGKATK